MACSLLEELFLRLPFKPGLNNASVEDVKCTCTPNLSFIYPEGFVVGAKYAGTFRLSSRTTRVLRVANCSSEHATQG